MYVTFEYHFVTSNVTFLRNMMMLYSDAMCACSPGVGSRRLSRSKSFMVRLQKKIWLKASFPKIGFFLHYWASKLSAKPYKQDKAILSSPRPKGSNISERHFFAFCTIRFLILSPILTFLSLYLITAKNQWYQWFFLTNTGLLYKRESSIIIQGSDRKVAG